MVSMAGQVPRLCPGSLIASVVRGVTDGGGPLPDPHELYRLLVMRRWLGPESLPVI